MGSNRKFLPPLNKGNIIKIAVPLLAAAFILAANIISGIPAREGSISFIGDGAYPEAFVKDAADAGKSIKCAMYMFKLDGYQANSPEEPIPVMAAAMTDAARRGAEVSVILELGKDDEITTKYNKSTAKYLRENGVRVAFDGPERRLHAKMCVIDGRITYIGSHNYTSSAMKYNSEVSVRVVSEEFAADAEAYLRELGL